jgi:hypothetical protein
MQAPLPSERLSTSPYTHCIGGIALVFTIEEDRKWIFFIVFRIGENCLPRWENLPPQSPKSCTQKSEEATRQQGGLFFRENSSNGGKAIRTFWRNTKFGKMTCQG